jgi:hypothetical protein
VSRTVDPPQGIGRTRVTALSWAGLALAAAGWAVLLAGDTGAAALGLAPDRAQTVAVAQMLVLSGIGLALFDALHAGFGALNRFFDAVLQRSVAKAAPPSHAPPSHAPARPAPQPARAAPQPATAQSEIVERGRFDGRAYLRYRDGSVEIETLLGVRRFSSMEEVEEFIGA